MSDIPEWAMKKADAADVRCKRDACQRSDCNSFLCVKALEAVYKAATELERERCAKIAEEDIRTAKAIEHDYKPTWYVRAQQIASAIREGRQG